MSYSTSISTLDASVPIVDDRFVMTDSFRVFALQVVENSLIIGTGTPEGVVEANPGRMYMNDAGTSGAILYIKRDTDIGGDKTQGWILV